MPSARTRARWTLCLLFAVAGCDCWNPFQSKVIVDVAPPYLSAVRNPETFDSQIPSLGLDADTPACLRSLATASFQAELEKVRSCDAYLTGSNSWNACHDEADYLHNAGVIMNDVADAIEGHGAFASSDGGQYLLLTKQLVGPQLYEAVVDDLTSVVASMECDLGCR